MRASILACAAIGAAVLQLPAAAEPQVSGQGSQPARIVDLAECIRLGLANDPGLRSDELESAAANARVREMQGQYVPSVALQAGYARLSEVAPGSMTIDIGVPKQVTFPATPVNSTIVKLSVQQPLFTGFRIASSIRQAEAVRASAGSDAARTRRDVRRSVEEAFWQLARAKVLAEASGEIQAQVERRLADVKTLYDQGVATNNDIVQAGMRLEDTHIDAGGAASARELARVRLAQLIGVPFSPGIDIADDPGAAVPAPAPKVSDGLDALVSRALAARPEVASARSRANAQDAALDLARAGRFPSVVLTGDYTLANPNQRVFPQADQFTGTWSVGIMASFDIGRYPQVAAQEDQARTRAAQAREAIRRVSEGIAAEVARAAIVLNAALQSYASLKIESAQAAENANFVQERFRQGVTLSSAQLDAQTLLVRARFREQAGLYDCLIARAALDAAVGE
jgi:outer membrane protein TolC